MTTSNKHVFSRLLKLAVIYVPLGLSFSALSARIDGSCSLNGIPLYGKVQIVDSFPDFKVKINDSFSDLKVKFVNAFPDSCGKWQIVNSFPDFKIQIVNAFEDFSVKKVSSFPGIN